MKHEQMAEMVRDFISPFVVEAKVHPNLGDSRGPCVEVKVNDGSEFTIWIEPE